MISSVGGGVFVSAKAAKHLIKSVVNVDGVSFAAAMEEKDGVICLLGSSEIEADHVAIDANHIEAKGKIKTLNENKSLEIHADEILRMDGTHVCSSGTLDLKSDRDLILRDTAQDSFLVYGAQGTVLRGEKIDLCLLDHPNSTIQSGDDLSLISNNPICSDAHFYADGDISFIDLNGELADLVSFYDPIISGSRTVRFASYTGVSLKVEAMRRIKV